ncbi:MAG: hypothetical protein Fur003_5290 [Candidatus Dojkabacteria bacterium]
MFHSYKKLFRVSLLVTALFFASINIAFALNLSPRALPSPITNTSWVNFKGSYTNTGYISNMPYEHQPVLQTRITSLPNEFLNSSAVVSNNILFYTKAFKSQMPCSHGKVYAYDLNINKTIWEAGSCENNYIPMFTGTVVSPTVAFDKLLLIDNQSMSIIALNSADGSLAWKTSPSNFGYVLTAPVQQANNLLTIVMQSEQIKIKLLNPVDGSVRRTINVNSSVGYSFAYHVTVKDNELYFVGSNSDTNNIKLYKMNLASGQIVWGFPIDSYEANVSIPVLAPGGVIIASERAYYFVNNNGTQKWAYTLQGEESYTNGISINKSLTSLSTERNDEEIATAQYYFKDAETYGTKLLGINLNTGKVIYNVNAAEKGTTSGANPINLANMKTLLITPKGQLKVFNTQTGVLISETSNSNFYPLTYTQYAPIAVNGKVIVVTQQDIEIYSVTTLPTD